MRLNVKSVAESRQEVADKTVTLEIRRKTRDFAGVTGSSLDKADGLTLMMQDTAELNIKRSVSAENPNFDYKYTNEEKSDSVKGS